MSDTVRTRNGARHNPGFSGPAEDGSGRFYTRVFLLAISLTLPMTIAALWLLRYIPLWFGDQDIHGLIAISVGIVGILIFFIFLYKFQMKASFSRNGRWVALILHALVVTLLFILLIWLAFDSPWLHDKMWGVYDLQEAGKPWIIAVLVIGSITLLGSLFDFLRRGMGGEYAGEEGDQER